MSTLAVTKKDFKGVRRAKTLWMVTGLLAVLAGLLAWVAGDPGRMDSEAAVARDLFNAIAVLLSFLLPIVVLVACYLAIAGERESGGIKFLLSLPNSRRDVFVGKFLSRTLVVTSSVLVMFLVVIVLSLVRVGTVPGVMLGIVALVALYGTVFVSIAVSLSAFVKTRSRAIGSAVGAYFGLIIINLGIPVISVKSIVSYAHHDILGMARNPDLYNFVWYLSPFVAFQKAKNLVMPLEMRSTMFQDSVRNEAEIESAAMNGREIAPELPVYLTDEFSLVIFAFWLVVPLAIGYWRFQRADLD
jgi:ABC-2 type transport system permease protein